jgi:mRNA interferase RelE/StbE
LLKAVVALAENPRPPASRKLAEHEDLYRLRVSDWCIIYAIHDNELLIVVIEIGSRGGVYRNY